MANPNSNLLANGEKFALIAIETRSEVDLPLTELAPGLWVASSSMIGLDRFWESVLGTGKIDNFRACTLSLLVRERSTDPAIDKVLRDRVWRFYAGMLLAGRFGTVKSLATAPPISRAIATPLGLDRAPRDGVCGCWEAVGKWPAGATVESLA